MDAVIRANRFCLQPSRTRRSEVFRQVNIYHIGASLKDLGKKWFAFSKMQMQVMEMLRKAGI